MENLNTPYFNPLKDLARVEETVARVGVEQAKIELASVIFTPKFGKLLKIAVHLNLIMK